MKYFINAMKGALLAVFATALISVPAMAGEYKGPSLSGQTVTISGPWLTADEESFEAVIAYFEKAQGPKSNMQVLTVLNSKSSLTSRRVVRRT